MEKGEGAHGVAVAHPPPKAAAASSSQVQVEEAVALNLLIQHYLLLKDLLAQVEVS